MTAREVALGALLALTFSGLLPMLAMWGLWALLGWC